MFSKFFIERPIFATVLAVIICLAGLVSLTALPVEQYPTITPVQVTVSATYPGADYTYILVRPRHRTRPVARTGGDENRITVGREIYRRLHIRLRAACGVNRGGARMSRKKQNSREKGGKY